MATTKGSRVTSAPTSGATTRTATRSSSKVVLPGCLDDVPAYARQLLDRSRAAGTTPVWAALGLSGVTRALGALGRLDLAAPLFKLMPPGRRAMALISATSAAGLDISGLWKPWMVAAEQAYSIGGSVREHTLGESLVALHRHARGLARSQLHTLVGDELRARSARPSGAVEPQQLARWLRQLDESEDAPRLTRGVVDGDDARPLSAEEGEQRALALPTRERAAAALPVAQSFLPDLGRALASLNRLRRPRQKEPFANLVQLLEALPAALPSAPP